MKYRSMISYHWGGLEGNGSVESAVHTHQTKKLCNTHCQTCGPAAARKTCEIQYKDQKRTKKWSVPIHTTSMHQWQPSSTNFAQFGCLIQRSLGRTQAPMAVGCAFEYSNPHLGDLHWDGHCGKAREPRNFISTYLKFSGAKMWVSGDKRINYQAENWWNISPDWNTINNNKLFLSVPSVLLQFRLDAVVVCDLYIRLGWHHRI